MIMAKTKRARSKKKIGQKLDGVVIGYLAGLDESGIAQVDFPANENGLLPALSSIPLEPKKVGQEVALLFENGDATRPIIMGFIQPPVEKPDQPPSHTANVDGEKIKITAKKEIVLECGKSSITLTSCGKVLIRGAYLLNRSSGVNRVKGASVHIN